MKTIPIRHIASTHRDQSDTGRFSIRDLRQLVNGKDLTHDLHKHDFFFVLFLQKGSGLHEIDFIQYPIHEYSIFILRPGQVHRLELKADASGFLMEFDQTFLSMDNSRDRRWKKALSKNYCGIDTVKFIKLHAILANVFEEFTRKQEDYMEAIRANLDLFFIEHIRQKKNQDSVASNESVYTQERFEELARLLEMNICSMKAVYEYATLLNLSPYQLNAITRASVGKTASDLIKDQIILEAKRYLLATSRQVKDIAVYLGYEDISYFIRFFKKQTGQSPEAFRKNFK